MAAAAAAAMVGGVSLSSTPRVLAHPSPPMATVKMVPTGSRTMALRLRAAPEGLSEKLQSSIESAKESCAEDPASGECVAAWDEVEELSAASSHARDKAKDSDPLETYCKDNPETDECRTYDD